jgi:hypothetical protein
MELRQLDVTARLFLADGRERKIITEITVETDTYQITVEPGVTIAAQRTTSRDIRRHKGLVLQPGHPGNQPGARETAMAYDTANKDPA